MKLHFRREALLFISQVLFSAEQGGGCIMLWAFSPAGSARLVGIKKMNAEKFEALLCENVFCFGGADVG